MRRASTIAWAGGTANLQVLRSRQMPGARLALRALLVMGALGALSGCTRPMPWCTRGYGLAHPTMAIDDLRLGNEARVQSVSEGASGTLGLHARE